MSLLTSIAPQITANEVIDDLRSGHIQELMAPFPRVTYRLEGEQASQRESLASIVPFFAMALFVIFTLLAIPLKSYSQPLIIMSVIPFALVGAIWGAFDHEKLGVFIGAGDDVGPWVYCCIWGRSEFFSGTRTWRQ